MPLKINELIWKELKPGFDHLEAACGSLETAGGSLKTALDSLETPDKNRSDSKWYLLGQERVAKALRMALAISADGYNIFVITESPSVNLMAIRDICSQYIGKKEPLHDVVYLQNFQEPCSPQALRLPVGEAGRFRGKIRAFLDFSEECLRSTATPQDVSRQIAEHLSVLKEQWHDAHIQSFLDAMGKDILAHTDNLDALESQDLCARYDVQVLRSDGTATRPVEEKFPSYASLFGTIEARAQSPEQKNNYFFMSKTGSFLKADGGAIIIMAEDVVSDDFLWKSLKKSLKYRQCIPELQHVPNLPAVTPEPIRVDTTAILVGSLSVFEKLYTSDAEFRDIFNLVAEFRPHIEWSGLMETCYRECVQALVEKENLLPVSPEGMQEIIFYGQRLSGKRNSISLRLDLIENLVREAHYGAVEVGAGEESAGKNQAGETKQGLIGELDVKRTIAVRENMRGLAQELLLEEVRNGVQLLELQDCAVGVVNGLAVVERAHISLGSVMRITVAVGPGKDGLINIERESGLSGELHDKGVFLLEGCLRHRYARRIPITISASIAVEQSYYEIDGDSASVAELVALLSAIAEIPLRQDLAVTGAVDQHGFLLPVGGIVEKIDGFFKICESLGLSGSQGVIVPSRNLNELMLPERVVLSVRDGSFHVWPARDVDEVLELLSGREAGNVGVRGRFPGRSFNEQIRKGLIELSGLG